MDLTNIKSKFNDLKEEMKKGGYSDTYVRNLNVEYNRILKHGSKFPTYNEYITNHINKSYSNKDNKRHIITFINLISRYDLYNQIPVKGEFKCCKNNDKYSKLSIEFKNIIDTYKSISDIKKSNDTINDEAEACIRLLLHLQSMNIFNLNQITEESILSYYIDKNYIPKYSCTYKKKSQIVFKKCINYIDKCEQIHSYFPKLRKIRKNIQYFEKYEIDKIKIVLESDLSISYRTKSIISILLYLGVRSCDIVNLKLDNIDWTNNKITFIQTKTKVDIELPLLTVVGNNLYNYIIKERPKSECRNLFVSESYDKKISYGTIYHCINKIMKKASVRMSKNDRRGSHLFRHNLATTMLKENIEQPIISKILGHTSSKSLEVYLHTDFVNLKKQSLSIEKFNYKEVPNVKI